MKFLRRLAPLMPALVCALLFLALPAYATQTDVAAPSGSGNSYAGTVTVLPNGNIVVVDVTYSVPAGAANVGAVYLLNGSDLSIISTLRGNIASDQVGSGGITVLSNGNFVVSSPAWDNPTGSKGNAGAVTWCSATTGVNGVVSATNSLVGGTLSDQVGSGGITALTNGSYVVLSPLWDNPADTVVNVGAVTWGNGGGGTVGLVTPANSLIGASGLNPNGTAVLATVGTGVVALTNGNYVVRSTGWQSFISSSFGAVTWGNGMGGTVGRVTSSNSLVGSDASAVTVLTNGNYVVGTPTWDNPTTGVADVGAVTLCNGATGTIGSITAGNSLIGGTAGDGVGTGVTALANGNYVVRSPLWDNPTGPKADVGAVTWGNGTTGTTGLVTTINSLVGGIASDQVGSASVTALTNGNYVVSSSLWDNPTGPVVNVGAVTWGNGAGGTVGLVTIANSLRGGILTDSAGSGGVTALTNGNYVVSSPLWDNPTGPVAGVGAVTWGNGATGSTGLITTANSLVGGILNDGVGANVTALTNGNYVVGTPLWDNPTGPVAGVGAATWGNGAGGTVGLVTSSNSLIGGTATDNVGTNVTALTNGNYVVGAPLWDNPTGPLAGVGAATWGNGAGGTVGLVTSSNSLIGGILNDGVGATGSVTALSNGDYQVKSAAWDNPSGPVATAGALSYGNGSKGVTGLVAAANSVLGTVATGIGGFAYDTVRSRTFVGRGSSKLLSILTLAGSPAVNGISPAFGSTAGGTSVTLTGTDFVAGATVTIGGTAATGITVVNATTITCTTPAKAAGTVASVVVTTASGGTSVADTFYTYANSPTVISIAPTSGSTIGGTSVTLTGTNFLAGANVTIGGTAATGVTVVNATTITATVPAGVAGTASVLVTTPGGTPVANTLYTYFVAAPVITRNPGDQGLTLGQTATFTATATSPPQPTVQWQVSNNGGSTFNDVPGATDVVFSFTPTMADSTKKYRAIFANVAGSVTSSAATLTMFSRPVGIRPGFNTTSLGATDDGFTPAPVSLGFTINLFGANYSACYANNNGNLTFDEPNPSFRPDPIANSALRIIAPFWGDVDTTGTGSGFMTYGAGTVNGHLAWGATWVNVGYYKQKVDKLDTFQVILIDRSDIGSGAFDIEFNYGPVVWEYGDASIGFAPRVGYSNGSTVSYEVPGSGVLGALPTGGANSLQTASGTYIFSSVSGTITEPPVPPVVTASTAVQTTAVTTVTITGTGFSTSNTNNTVLFNLGAAGNVTSATPTQLIVTFTVRPTAGNLMAMVTSFGESSASAVQVATVVPPVIVTTTAVNAPPNTVAGTVIAGASWASIRSGMVMSGSGALAYRGYMDTTGGVTANDFQGIWKTPDGTTAAGTLVARSGVTLEPSVGALFDILPINPIINNAAQTSFTGMLRVNSGTPAVTLSTDTGVWSELGTGGLKKLLREGDTLSGSTVGTVAPSTWIAGSASAAAFTTKLGTGSALVRVDVAGTTVTPSIVAKQGDTAPVMTGGDAGTFDSMVGNTTDPRMDAAGNVAFLSTVIPAGQGIWYKTVAGALTAVANTNQTAPGQGGPVFTGFERPSLSSDGSTIAFRAFLSGANGQSVFKGSVAAPVAIAKSNDTAIAGVPAGRKLWNLWSPFTNNTGKVAFRVSLVDTATNANEARAIATDANGTLTVIAKVGDTAPGLGAETFANFDHPIIGDGNQCAFIASTSGGTVGLFRQAAGGGALVLVTMVGDLVNISGGGFDTIAQMVVPGTTTDDRKYETKAIDASGRILVHVTYASGKTGIFLSSL